MSNNNYSESVVKIVESILNADISKLQDYVNEAIGEKLDKVLEEKRIAMTADMFNGGAELTLEDYSVEELEAFMESEEYEQLDELSKKTLGSYIEKSAKDAVRHSEKEGFAVGNREPFKTQIHHNKVVNKRRVGIAKAVDKLTKESVELAEDKKDVWHQETGHNEYRVIVNGHTHSEHTGVNARKEALAKVKELKSKLKEESSKLAV